MVPVLVGHVVCVCRHDPTCRPPPGGIPASAVSALGHRTKHSSPHDVFTYEGPGVAGTTDGRRRPAGQTLILSSWRFAWLLPLTLLPQWLMNAFEFGPDMATGLVPPPHLLCYYAVFFGFGAFYFDARDDERRRSGGGGGGCCRAVHCAFRSACGYCEILHGVPWLKRCLCG